MVLWIRTQDDGLSYIVDILPVTDNKITAYSINGRCMCLGTYKTKKRALEVLDEIQDILNVFDRFIKEPKDMFKNFFIPPCYVYDMPEE